MQLDLEILERSIALDVNFLEHPSAGTLPRDSEKLKL